MIYIDTNIDGFDLARALAAVGPGRREYALRYWKERDRRLCVAASLLLLHALQVEGYAVPHPLPPFIPDRRGKPHLSGFPDVHFSLSHCSVAVACALSDGPVGVDIETMDHYSPEVAAQVMNDEEMRQITASPHPARTFTRLWTMKESLYKLTGDGCGCSDPKHLLRDTSRVRFQSWDSARYVVSACRHLHADALDAGLELVTVP